MKQGVELLLVRIEKRIQLCGDREDDMEVGSIDHFALPFVDPDLLKDCLTVRAVPVPAGVSVEIRVVTGLTAADVITEFSGLAVHDAVSGLFLFCRRMETGAVFIPAEPEDLLYL